MTSQCWAPKRNEPNPQAIIDYTGAFPCELSTNGGDVACCRAGDKCLEGGICQYGTPEPDGRLYYVAGCTDSNFEDPSCNRHCFQSAWPEITYLNSSESFGCCLGPMGSSAPDCSQPTGETWQAPSPADLKVLDAIPATPSSGWMPPTAAPSSSTGAAAASTPETTAAKPTPSASSSDEGLDTGAKVGIGVGVGIGVPLIALLAGILWVLARRRRRAASPTLPVSAPASAAYGPVDPLEKSAKPSTPPDFYGSGGKPGDMPPGYATYRSEMSGSQIERQEMHAQQIPMELPADNSRR